MRPNRPWRVDDRVWVKPVKYPGAHARPRVCATIQARMTSSRLPGKVLLEAAGKPLLEHMIERLERAPALDGIIVATTTNGTDDPIAALAERLGVGCYRGYEDDVLSRILEAAQRFDADVIVRTTGDCPLLCPGVVTRVVETYLENGADYVSNSLAPSFPIGQDVEVFSTRVLEDVARRTDDASDLEHVSLYIYRNPQLYSLLNVAAPPELTALDLRLTVDEPADYELVKTVFERLYSQNPAFTLGDILDLVRAESELAEINRHVRQRAV